MPQSWPVLPVRMMKLVKNGRLEIGSYQASTTATRMAAKPRPPLLPSSRKLLAHNTWQLVDLPLSKIEHAKNGLLANQQIILSTLATRVAVRSMRGTFGDISRTRTFENSSLRLPPRSESRMKILTTGSSIILRLSLRTRQSWKSTNSIS